MAACQITIFDLAAVLAQRVALLTRHTLNCSKHGQEIFITAQIFCDDYDIVGFLSQGHCKTVH